MEVTVTKVVVLLMLGAIKLVCGLAPLALRKAIKKQKNDWWIKKFIGELIKYSTRKILAHTRIKGSCDPNAPSLHSWD